MIDLLNYFKDPNFRFDPESHTYTYFENDEPVQIFESVSGFISQFKKPFDSQRISKYVARSRGVTQAEILAEWKEKGDIGKRVGTITHDWIENFYKGQDPLPPVDESALIRINEFKKLYEKRLYKLNPVEFELRIFSRKWGIAGTLDSLFEIDQRYYVGDWKSNKDFTDNDHPKGTRQKLLYPFEDLWDNNLNGYSIQVSTYRLILEEHGFNTDGAFLAWIGPNNSKIYRALDLRDRLRSFLDRHSLAF